MYNYIDSTQRDDCELQFIVSIFSSKLSQSWVSELSEVNSSKVKNIFKNSIEHWFGLFFCFRLRADWRKAWWKYS